MPESPAAVFERLCAAEQPGSRPGEARTGPPAEAGTGPDTGDNRGGIFDRAFVLGGSIAGLLAARVLADHARSVVIVERDDSAARTGVPQSLQVHTLLPGGLTQLERWFPGFAREAMDGGALAPASDGIAVYTDGVRHVRTPNPDFLTASRPFVETLLRRRTLATPGIEVVKGQATGLTYQDGAVRAVRYETPDGVERTGSADFVVDAMGRSSRLADWLERDGWERPGLERKRIDINYATGFFKRAEDPPAVATAVARTSAAFADRTQAALNAVEDGRWMVLLAGYGDNRPGRTEEDFRARCGDLPPVFGEAVGGELVGEIRTYHQADSRRRHFSRLGRVPGRLIAVGDAVASFNPIYGQGMASAALHASCLSEYLRGGPDLAAPARRFFELQDVVVDAAWSISTSADAARFPDERKPSVRVRLHRWVTDQVVAATIIDERIATRFNAVTCMTAHPSSLASLGTALRALSVNRRARRGATGHRA
ncbi:FAD-dependent monooxygenase [Streptomyces sp. 150FB]|uniref:FAD-dependent oxidoreductase n=1 Tax=Streptomyces sp. 150FB TaxID=1576605 RepID=UPI0007C815E0|nr:FAD-dependent monooxygenase [Streptomyces sp. 150FB]